MNEDEARPTLSCYFDLQRLIGTVRDAKPNDRSDADRRFAIVITDLEKIEAYFNHYIIEKQGK